MFSGAADAATITFFNPSQTATLVAEGVTSTTISSEGYLFTYTRDKLSGGGTGRPERVSWPDGVEAQGLTVDPTGKAEITLSRLDATVFDISAFTVQLLGSTAATGAAFEVMPLVNGQDGFPDPVAFDASGFPFQMFSYNTQTPQSTLPLTGFDTYRMSLFVDFALRGLTLVDASVTVDGGPVDGGPVDGGPVDGGPVDGGPVDGGPVDGGPVDGGGGQEGSTGAPEPAAIAMLGLGLAFALRHRRRS
jgi:hypothetical protein